MTEVSNLHVIYHRNCFDGYGAAWAAWKATPQATFISANYGESPPDLPSDADVVIADFSYPRAVLEELRPKVRSLTILDHHKTAQEALEGFPRATFDMDHSGAYLAWKYFHPDREVPSFILYIEDRDLWRFQLPQSKEFSAALRSYPMDFALWDTLSRPHSITQLQAEGVHVLRHTQQMVDTMCKNARWKDIGGYQIPYTNATVYFSEVANRLRELHPKAPFAAYYFDRTDTQRQWGLRSGENFDCSKVAKQFGGGGHPTAAGFVETLNPR